jgi:hypothetical protein
MFTALSANAGRSDLAEQKRYIWKSCARHAAIVQRENALIYHLLAGRFALNSSHRLLLHMLARSAVHRVRRLEVVLHDLPEQRHHGHRDDGRLPGNVGMPATPLASGHSCDLRMEKTDNWLHQVRDHS